MKRVRSLGHLMRLAQDRRSVIQKDSGPLVRPKPAAFLIAWHGNMIYWALKRGLYVYERKQK